MGRGNWVRRADRWLRREPRHRLETLRQGVQQVWARLRLNQAYPIQTSGETIGEYGERLAATYLQRCGYTILERSFRTRLGEIDLIAAWRTERVVFVEVKTWSNPWENAGGPADAVDDTKQAKITNTALIYLKRHGLLGTPCRLDVIEVLFDATSRQPRFRHFEGAFEAVGNYQLFS